MESGMQFMTALFGESAGAFLNAAFALGIVLVLIVLGTWVLKLASQRGGDFRRTPSRRLKIVESAVVDGRRRVLIVRRDNVEHVIMTGGPQDLLIESGLAVSETAHSRQAAPAKPSHHPDSKTSEEVPARPQTAAAYRPYPPLRPVLPRLRDESISEVIPISAAVIADNSEGQSADSARTGTVEGLSGHVGGSGRSRFLRGVLRDRN
jgi:flagellar protein FliO/FliZ